MPTLWEAFLEDYANEIFNWSLRYTLEVFWHYCQDGSRAVAEFQKDSKETISGLNKESTMQELTNEQKIDKIIKLLEEIKANQPVPYYPPIVYYPPCPQPYYPPGGTWSASISSGGG